MRKLRGDARALAVSRVVGGAGEARLAREEAEDLGHDLFDLMNDGACERASRQWFRVYI
jgi:hypothetical protein